MSKAKQMTIRIDNVRLSFPHLFQPDAMNEGDAKAYSADFILPPDHPQKPAIEQALRKLATDAWDDNGANILKELVDEKRVFIKPGSKKRAPDGTVRDGYDGQLFISARSKVRPTLVDADRSPLDESSGKLYSGVYVNAFLALWVQDNKFGRRINAQVQGVQYLRKGDSLGGGTTADPSVFETLEGEFEDAPAADDSDSSESLI